MAERELFEFATKSLNLLESANVSRQACRSGS